MDENENKKALIDVDKTLAALDDLPRIETNPYFYARLKARLQDLDRGVSTRPGLAVYVASSVLMLVILANVITGTMVLRGGSLGNDAADPGSSATSSEEYLFTGSSGALDIVSE